MLIDFGKYEGKKITDVPQYYLVWLVKQEIDPSLREAIRAHLGLAPVQGIPSATKEAIKRRFKRALTVDYSPDDEMVQTAEKVLESVLEGV